MAFMRLFAIAQSDSIEGFIELCRQLSNNTNQLLISRIIPII